jgi:hypothetical protein
MIEIIEELKCEPVVIPARGTACGLAQMFEILDDTENGIVRVAFVGEIQPTDYEVSGPTFGKVFETRKPLRLLLDWTRFSGWSQESESQAFFFRIRHRGDIERISIVGESKWRSAAPEIDTIVDAEVRLYDTRIEDEAMRWLRND